MYASFGQVKSSTDLSVRTFRLVRRFLSESFNIPFKQIPRILFHGLILSCIISGFWLLDSVKDPVLATIVGMEYQPAAKLLSVVFVLFVVCIYDYLTSIVSKPSLFHIVCNFFGFVFMIYAAMLSNDSIGLPNRNAHPSRVLGWLIYFTIEAYGSLSVALFWSFTNSIMDLEQAKGAYGLIIAIAQVGAVFGSTLATNASTIGIPRLFIFGSMLVFPVSILIKVYHITFTDHATIALQTRVRSDSEASSHGPNLLSEGLASDFDETSSVSSFTSYEELVTTKAPAQKAKPSGPPSLLTNIYNSMGGAFTGFVEGVSLIVKYPYVMKLLGVCCIYEIVVVILDYEFKLMGSHAAVMKASAAAIRAAESGGTGSSDASNQFANLLGHFGQVTNIIAFLLSLFGFSFLVHRIGVKHSLMIFPTFLLGAVIVSYLVPTLWVLFIFVSIIKALLFSLHDPVKEILYIPTSEPIKFKAKAWIDVFGSRLAKALGSIITTFAFGNYHTLRNIGEIPALVCAIVALLLTWSIGEDFTQLVADNTVVGDVFAKITYDVPTVNGLRPGDVGYSGYDPHLFEGVFDDEDGTVGNTGHQQHVPGSSSSYTYGKNYHSRPHSLSHGSNRSDIDGQQQQQPSSMTTASATWWQSDAQSHHHQSGQELELARIRESGGRTSQHPTTAESKSERVTITTSSLHHPSPPFRLPQESKLPHSHPRSDEVVLLDLSEHAASVVTPSSIPESSLPFHPSPRLLLHKTAHPLDHSSRLSSMLSPIPSLPSPSSPPSHSPSTTSLMEEVSSPGPLSRDMLSRQHLNEGRQEEQVHLMTNPSDRNSRFSSAGTINQPLTIRASSSPSDSLEAQIDALATNYYFSAAIMQQQQQQQLQAADDTWYYSI